MTTGWRGIPLEDLAEQMTVLESFLFCEISLNELVLWKRDRLDENYQIRSLFLYHYKFLKISYE
jgi:hypothetical protein